MDPVYSLAREVFELEDSFPLSDRLGVGAVPGWDSLGTMKLALAVEERFGIQLALEEISELGTLGDLRQALKQRGVAS
jgi:acyl carrier protein